MTLMLHIVVGCTYLWIHKYTYLYLSPTTSAAARVNINERRRLTNHSQLIYLLLPAIGNEATGISRRRRIRWRSTRHAGAQKTPHPIRGDKKASYRFWTLFLPLLTRAHKTIENPSATFFFLFRTLHPFPSVVLVAVLLPFAESLSSCAESPKLSTAVFVPVLPTDRPPSISSYRMAKQGVSVFIASMGTRELSNGEAHFKRSNNRNCNSSPPPTDQWLSGGSRSASVPSTKPSNNCYSGTQPPRLLWILLFSLESSWTLVLHFFFVYLCRTWNCEEVKTLWIMTPNVVLPLRLGEEEHAEWGVGMRNRAKDDEMGKQNRSRRR